MYLDPGFGSMIIQVLIASFAAAATLFGVFRVRILAFLKKGKETVKEETNDE